MNAWFPRLTMHSLVIVISVLTYVLTTRIGEERRPPSIAIAWVLGMIAVPYLALPMYLFFGRRKLQRKPSPSGIRSHSAHWAEELIESFGLPPAAPSRVRLHTDAGESSAALFEVMAAAESRLDICTYILGNDDFGREAIGRMIDSARRGARVQLAEEALAAVRRGREIIDALVTHATGTAERDAAGAMIADLPDTHRVTVGGDKNYDTNDFVAELRERAVTPHVAQNDTNRRSAIDGRTTRHPGYSISQCIRKRIEEAFGWIKTVAGQEKTKFRGCDRVGWAFTFGAAAYNLTRLPKLLAALA